MNDFIKKCTAIFVFLMVYTLIANAQTGGPEGDPPPIPTIGAIKANGDPKDSIYVLENCHAIPFRVLLANLEQLPTPPPGELLPGNYPPMYLEYSVLDGPLETVKLTSADFLGVINNINVYAIDIESYYVDLQNVCSTVGSTSISFTMRLVTPTYPNETLTWVDYPACDYVDPCDIFSCYVFENAGNCFPGGNLEEPLLDLPCLADPSNTEGPINEGSYGNCSNTGLTNGSRNDFSVYCSHCHSATPDDNGATATYDGSTNITAYPNPFEEQVAIRWSEQTGINRLNLYSSNGMLLDSWNQLDKASFLKIDMGKYPKGVFFLKGSSIDSQHIIKLIKQ